MKTLILHVPGLYNHLQQWKMKSATGKRLRTSVREQSLSETYAANETFLTINHEVLLANYRFDVLTILYVHEPQQRKNEGIICYLKAQGIDYFPLETSLLLNKRVKEKV
ncbi:hypothetical protein [Sporosarcina sp. ITBMC105]